MLNWATQSCLGLLYKKKKTLKIFVTCIKYCNHWYKTQLDMKNIYVRYVYCTNNGHGQGIFDWLQLKEYALYIPKFKYHQKTSTGLTKIISSDIFSILNNCDFYICEEILYSINMFPNRGNEQKMPKSDKKLKSAKSIEVKISVLVFFWYFCLLIQISTQTSIFPVLKSRT